MKTGAKHFRKGPPPPTRHSSHGTSLRELADLEPAERTLAPPRTTGANSMLATKAPATVVEVGSGNALAPLFAAPGADELNQVATLARIQDSAGVAADADAAVYAGRRRSTSPRQRLRRGRCRAARALRSSSSTRACTRAWTTRASRPGPPRSSPRGSRSSTRPPLTGA